MPSSNAQNATYFGDGHEPKGHVLGQFQSENDARMGMSSGVAGSDMSNADFLSEAQFLTPVQFKAGFRDFVKYYQESGLSDGYGAGGANAGSGRGAAVYPYHNSLIGNCGQETPMLVLNINHLLAFATQCEQMTLSGSKKRMTPGQIIKRIYHCLKFR